MKTPLSILALLTVSACSSAPDLYSPVIPMRDGTLHTANTTSSEAKSLVRTTRNAERYCKSLQSQGYLTDSIKTEYNPDKYSLSQLTDDNEATRKVEDNLEAAGILSDNGTYTTTLVFVCQ